MLFRNIRSDYYGYSTLIREYHESVQTDSSLTLKFQQWFDAHLCAPLGVVLNMLVRQHSIFLNEASSSGVLDVLRRNGFLRKFGLDERYDHNQTVIHYKEFSSRDDKAFSRYVFDELLNHSSFPRTSNTLKSKMLESLAELFSNAVLHSKSDIITTCGQFYPRNHEITFTIADAGIGIHQNVINFHQKQRRDHAPQNAGQSIVWAMQEGNTTKNNPGGSGLAILKEFVKMNKGFIHLVSHEGYYECSENGETSRLFAQPFPGTFATVKFNTDDKNSYILSSETDPNTLF